MRILVTGARGQLGWELARSLMPLGEVLAVDRVACDLAVPGALARCVATARPDVIVNAAAYTAVDRAESEEALADRINGEALAELGAAARGLGALVLHYSTDYVFDGQGDQPWRPEAETAPMNAYGRSKLLGEIALRDSAVDHLILRTTWVYGARGQNFLRTMLRLGAEREQLGVVADQIGAPCWVRNLADASAQILAQAQRERREGRFAAATMNLVNGGETSWHGFAEAIFAEAPRYLPAYPLRVRQLEAIPSDAYPTPAKRPANSRLDPRALQERFGILLPPWRQALCACLAEMGEASLPWSTDHVRL